MRITPITKIPYLRNSLRRTRALMAISYDEHTVIDTETGERHTLPAKEAWELCGRLNEWA